MDGDVHLQQIVSFCHSQTLGLQDLFHRAVDFPSGGGLTGRKSNDDEKKTTNMKKLVEVLVLG